jgi:thiosulfate/3-mercaptopyruvate sulfurtransferase
MLKKLVLLIASVSMIGFAPCVQAFVKTQGHVSDVDFVSEKVGDPNWVILDARSKAEYEDGHIPGAVNYGKPAVVVLKHPADGRVVSVKEAEKLLGAIGLDNNKGLIIYGTKGDYHVTCEQIAIWLGVKQYYYLDGGYEAWVKSGKQVQTDAVKPVPAVFKADPAKMNKKLYVSTKEMIAIAKKQPKNVTLIDTRSPEEFNATENSTLRQGRIPGAINIPYEKNLDKETKKMLSMEVLAEIYKDIPKDNAIIVYCHRGCRTAYSFFALEWLGYKNVRIYEDSWVVYGARPDTPIENEHYINLRPTVSAAKDVSGLKARLDYLEERLNKLEKK